MFLLRRPVTDDASALARAGNHAAIAHAMLSLPNPFMLDDALSWISESNRQTTRDGYVVYEASQGTVVGVAELREIDPVHRQAEVSFWLSYSMWGRGVGAIALAALVQIAFDIHGLNRVYGYHMRRNPASGRVMAKCGFRQEGVLRERVWKAGVPEDAVLWARLAGDERVRRTVP